MVFVDKVFFWPGKGSWCHMWADTAEELHEFAAKLGLKRDWFQDHRMLKHYDILPERRECAIKMGAKVESLRNYLKNVKTM